MPISESTVSGPGVARKEGLHVDAVAGEEHDEALAAGLGRPGRLDEAAPVQRLEEGQRDGDPARASQEVPPSHGHHSSTARKRKVRVNVRDTSSSLML